MAIRVIAVRALFGYADQLGKLVWYCERHRLAQWWADARRDGSMRHPILDAGGTIPADQDRQEARENAMDMSKYGTAFIEPEDVRDGPRQERIANVYIHQKFKCPVLTFESGEEFLVNQTNCRALNRTYGTESDLWLGQLIQLSLGHYMSDDEEKETVALKPISRPQPSVGNGNPETAQAIPKPRPPARDPMDDAIPF
jgi:hypothetical protein